MKTIFYRANLVGLGLLCLGIFGTVWRYQTYKSDYERAVRLVHLPIMDYDDYRHLSLREKQAFISKGGRIK